MLSVCTGSFLLERAGYREETYFTVSHAPAFDDDGQVAGIHAVCTEVTREVLAARRQRLLREVAAVGTRLGEETAARAVRVRGVVPPLDSPVVVGLSRSGNIASGGNGGTTVSDASGGTLYSPTDAAGNPIPIVVPCHRVLRSGGHLGGYGGGLPAKRLLLALESGEPPLL